MQCTPCPHSVRPVAALLPWLPYKFQSQQNTRAHHLHLQKGGRRFRGHHLPTWLHSRRFKDRGLPVRPLVAIELSFAAATCRRDGTNVLAFTRAYSFLFFPLSLVRRPCRAQVKKMGLPWPNTACRSSSACEAGPIKPVSGIPSPPFINPTSSAAANLSSLSRGSTAGPASLCGCVDHGLSLFDSNSTSWTKFSRSQFLRDSV